MIKWINNLIDKRIEKAVDEWLCNSPSVVMAAAKRVDFSHLAKQLGDDEYNKIAKFIDLSTVASMLDEDDIASKMSDSITVDDVAEKVAELVDAKDIADQINLDNLDLDYSCLELDYEEIAKALIKLASRR